MCHVTQSHLIGEISAGWGRNPSLFTEKLRAAGLAAALWRGNAEKPIEVTGPAFADIHIISVQQTPYFVEEVRKNGQLTMGRLDLRRGSAQLMEAGVRPSSVMGGAWDVLHLYLPTILIDTVLHDEYNIATSAIEWRDPLREQSVNFETIGNEVIEEMRHRLPLSRLRLDSLGLQAAITLLRHHSNLSDQIENAKSYGRPDWRLRRACEYLEQHLIDDPGLAEVAGMIGISVRHLNTLFRKGLGLAPHQWFAERRIAKAKEFLSETSLSITQIAYACGFASAQHFATVFRAVTGSSPSAWRNKLP